MAARGRQRPILDVRIFLLTTVLPDGAQDLMWPVQAPEWRAGSWRGEGKAQSFID